MSKKRRFVSSTTTPRRPIDKEIKSVFHQTVNGVQDNTVLKTTTFPCTIVGLRWEITALMQITSSQTQIAWVIVVVRDGDAPNSISFSNGSNFYQPEQNVLTWGLTELAAGTQTDANPPKRVWRGDTKTMRKLKQGDQLFFTSLGGPATVGPHIHGVVQFFCKS